MENDSYVKRGGGKGEGNKMDGRLGILTKRWGECFTILHGRETADICILQISYYKLPRIKDI